MRHFSRFAMVFVWLTATQAQAPPPDSSPGYFAGEWAGTGELGSYCYVMLNADGTGWVLIDGGSGDWRGAQVQWRNRLQSLQIERTTPLIASPQRRIMPLESFSLGGGFNQSLSLTSTALRGGCQLQKSETTAQHLSAARGAIEGLRLGELRP
jgi:hypothetical protein